ncbi:MAG: hypothetical protein QW655_05160 [Nitrososphaerota archaeon]|nr:hypothetical protein [Candidatus Geocrenenecus dongiae]
MFSRYPIADIIAEVLRYPPPPVLADTIVSLINSGVAGVVTIVTGAVTVVTTTCVVSIGVGAGVETVVTIVVVSIVGVGAGGGAVIE